MDKYTILTTLGKGNFATVTLAENKADQHRYAIKTLPKDFQIQNDEVRGATIEKSVLAKAREYDHPFITKLYSTFQTESRLCFVLEYCPGGDLEYHIQKGDFGIERARFYAAEACLALKFLHENGIIYRGLQLDNIVLTSDGHIKLIDFIVAAEGIYDRYGTTKTFCGTSEFMAPEILLDKAYTRAVDWWAFGILLYQMLLHESPFRGEDEDEIYDSILDCKPTYPEHMPLAAKDLVSKLLVLDPEQRLGYHDGAEEITRHEFFSEMDFEALYRKEVEPPFRPVIRDRNDLSNFDAEFTKVVPASDEDSNVVLTPEMQEQFKDFSSRFV